MRNIQIIYTFIPIFTVSHIYHFKRQLLSCINSVKFISWIDPNLISYLAMFGQPQIEIHKNSNDYPNLHIRKNNHNQRYSGTPSTNVTSLLRITDPQTHHNSNVTTLKPNSQLNSSNLTAHTKRSDNDSGTKRLKLKDYMHLASLQKKSKSKSVMLNSKLECQPQLLNESRKIKQSIVSNQKQSIILKKDPIHDENYYQIFKEQIDKKIEYQIVQLQNLQDYVKRGIKNDKNHNETQLHMFSIYNTIKGSSTNYNELGDKIVEYEKKGESASKNYKNYQYYWEKKEKRLESPAKIFNKELDMH